MSEYRNYGYGIVDRDDNIAKQENGADPITLRYVSSIVSTWNSRPMPFAPYRVVQLFWREIQDSNAIPPQASQSSGTGTGTADK